MISPNALKALYRLRDNGHIAYLVGGCVRDLLLGREPKDFDLVTDATPGRLKKLFRNCRLVGRRFRLAHLHFGDEIIEVATFRASGPDGDDAPAGETAPAPDTFAGSGRLLDEEGMVLRDNVFGTPAEDAIRRDFTVNALAYDIDSFSIIDFVGGAEDIERGVIRTIGDPLVRFTEDPVRMIRAVRFAAILGFTIEESTLRAIGELAGSVNRASPPRLYEEVLKLFLSGEAEMTYQLMRRTGLFAPLFPSFSEWLDRETGGFPHVRMGRDLDWVDGRVASGQKVSPSLLLALLFGEYLEECSDEICRSGRSPEEGLKTAMEELHAVQNQTVSVPQRVWLAMREILSLQVRLRKIPGKRPGAVILRSAFKDALDYLRCRCQVMEEEGKKARSVIRWWERYAEENAGPVQEAGETRRAPRHRRRRRRNGPRKPASAGTNQVPSGTDSRS
jgi:poly(A) polymerase